jgi:hypothetical protein
VLWNTTLIRIMPMSRAPPSGLRGYRKRMRCVIHALLGCDLWLTPFVNLDSCRRKCESNLVLCTLVRPQSHFRIRNAIDTIIFVLCRHRLAILLITSQMTMYQVHGEVVLRSLHSKVGMSGFSVHRHRHPRHRHQSRHLSQVGLHLCGLCTRITLRFDQGITQGCRVSLCQTLWGLFSHYQPR